ncbi:hypothetical protein LJC59_03025 [Desulfovibrio sp. OttesenSCG-928-A18]|nr:hypothetical protein [Desulfovibrio sp. OttesenSCG-928-A18]
MDWTPSFSEADFNTRMENAFRRVSGSIGHELSRDRGNTRALKNSATSALESGVASAGPLFMRLGRGALDLSRYKVAGMVNIKECAADILREFFDEGNAAYHAAAAEMRAQALSWLQEKGLDEKHSAAVLSSADSSFQMPSKEEFTQAAMEFCNERVSPLTMAGLAGLAVAAPVVALLRSPVLAVLLGLGAAIAAFCFLRGARRARVEKMVHMLPRRLYDLLDGGLKTNARRYGEIVRAGAGEQFCSLPRRRHANAEHTFGPA